jgi:aconitate hydratase
MSIYDASVHYQAAGVPLVVFAGRSTARAARATGPRRARALLGVKAVIAESFERIHRSNLVGMGVLPCQFKDHTNAATLNLDGTETFDITGLEGVRPRQDVTLVIRRQNGETEEVPLTLALTRRLRLTTTSTAAFCRSCCGS